MWTVRFSACDRLVLSRRVHAGLRMFALLTVACAWTKAAQAAPLPTTTTLALSSSTVASPAEVTLTAAVTGAGTGTVTFCNAAATLCEDAAIVGRAQLVAGTATLRIIPAIGTHTYKAFFNGTATAAASTSATQTLTVTGIFPTTTAIAATGGPTGYALTATVVGFASQPPVLAGSVTFQDTTFNNLLGVVALGTPVLAQTYSAAPGSPVQTGNQPAIAGVGDFNEDGIPDLAIENAGDSTISILLGKGDGTFSAPLVVPVVGTPPCENLDIQSNCAIVVGDFNNDGHLDLAVASDNDNTVVVLKGNGQGSFTPFSGSPIPVGSFPQALKVGDFNNDGIQDLVVANANDDTLTILLGNGDGTFTQAGGSPVSAGIGSFPFFIAVADLNNDGNADLAVVNGRDNTVTFLEGNGDGTFAPFAGSPYTFATNAGSGPIVAADFNGDGNVDLAIANFESGLPTGNVVVLLGDGHGNFTFSTQAPVGSNPFSMVALDYNGDGITDLAVANYYYDFSPNPPPGTLSLLIGKGDGTFTSPNAAITLGQFPNDVVTADFNGDGHPDLAIPDSGDTYTTILLNTFTQTATATLDNVILVGAGTHVVKATYPANASFATSSATIDLNGVGETPAITLSANPPAQLDTLAVTFTAQLNPLLFIAPTGTVSFFNGGALLGTVAVTAGGQALYTTSSLGDGIHSITATYSGDPVYQAASTATALSITISDLQVTRVGKSNTTVLPGTTVVYTLTVAPLVASTFLDNVNLSASSLPAGATATFSPATLNAGSMTATVTMTIATSATALNAPPSFPFARLPLALGLLLPLFGARRLRRHWRKIPATLPVLVLAALSLMAAIGLNGCSGAGLFAARKVPYAITVTATEGNSSGTLARNTQVPLAIQ
jgi:hypothetical protein